jgi:hypothetical protein
MKNMNGQMDYSALTGASDLQQLFNAKNATMLQSYGMSTGALQNCQNSYGGFNMALNANAGPYASDSMNRKLTAAKKWLSEHKATT